MKQKLNSRGLKHFEAKIIIASVFLDMILDIIRTQTFHLSYMNSSICWIIDNRQQSFRLESKLHAYEGKFCVDNSKY